MGRLLSSRGRLHCRSIDGDDSSSISSSTVEPLYNNKHAWRTYSFWKESIFLVVVNDQLHAHGEVILTVRPHCSFQRKSTQRLTGHPVRTYRPTLQSLPLARSFLCRPAKVRPTKGIEEESLGDLCCLRQPKHRKALRISWYSLKEVRVIFSLCPNRCSISTSVRLLTSLL